MVAGRLLIGKVRLLLSVSVGKQVAVISTKSKIDFQSAFEVLRWLSLEHREALALIKWFPRVVFVFFFFGISPETQQLRWFFLLEHEP